MTSSIGKAFVKAIFLKFVDLLFQRLLLYWVPNLMLLVQKKLGDIKQDPTVFFTKTVFEDPLTILLGPKRRGVVRRFGHEANATKLQLIAERDDNFNRLEDKCSKMEEQMKNLQATISLLLKNQVNF